MIINRLEIVGYGKWVHQTIDFSANFQIIQGMNEAGKSTLRSFIEHVLFGFPTKKAIRQRYLPLTGERMGGRIWLQDERLGSLVAERLLIQGKVRFQAWRVDGAFLSEEEWQAVLHQTTLKQYLQLFSFNVEQLQQFQLLSPAEMNRYLYSVSLTGSEEWVQHAHQLKNQAAKIFTPRSTKKLLNQQLLALEEQWRQVQQHAQQQADYQVLMTQMEHFIQVKETLQAQLAQQQEYCHHKQTLLECWELYQAYVTKKAAKKELPPLKEEWKKQVKEASLTLTWLQQEINQQQKLQEKWYEQNRQMTAILANPQGTTLRTLLHQEEQITDEITRYENIHQSLVTLQQEIELEATFWQVDVSEIPLPLTLEQQTWLQKTHTQVEVKRQQLQRLEQQRIEQQHQQQTWTQQLQAQESTNRLMNRYGIKGGLLLLAGMLLWQSDWHGMAILTWLGGLGWVSYEWAKGQATTGVKQYVRDNLYQLQEEMKRTKQVLASETKEYQQLQAQLEQWFSKTAYVATAITLEQLIEGDALASLRELLQKRQVLQKEEAAYQHRMEELAAQWHWYFEASQEVKPKTYAAQWKLVQKALMKMEVIQKEESFHYQELTHIQERLLNLQEHYQTQLQTVQAILEQAQIPSLEQFDHYLALYQEEEQRQAACSQLEQLLLPHLEDLQQYQTRSQLEAEVIQSQQQVSQLTTSYQQTLTQLAAVDHQKKQSEQDGTYQEQQLEFEMLKSQVREQLVEWASSHYASEWILDSLAAQLPTQQPHILKDASDYLKRLTNGRYETIYFVEEELYLRRFDGQRFTKEMLSRGTLDQVLVALRVAFVKNISKTIPLPVLIDDGFVNFDRERKAIVLELLEELSKNVQVIYFTLEDDVARNAATVYSLPIPERGNIE